MTISRVANSQLYDRGVSNIQNNLSFIADLQNKIASGRRIEKPSEDPVGATQLLGLLSEDTQSEQYIKNIEEGLSEISLTDNALGTVGDIAQRARELAVRASNAAVSQSQLSGFSSEVEGLISQLVSAGNTTYGGRYIFSGFKTDTAPFSLNTTTGTVTFSGSPTTENYERTVQTAKGTKIAINVNGEDVLGNVTVSGSTVTGSGLLYNLTVLKKAMDSADYTTVRSSIDQIQGSLQDILEKQSDLAGRYNELEMTKNRIEDRRVLQTQSIATLQNVDLPKAISDLNFQQNIYEGSLSILQRILNTSLVNFLQ